MRTLSKHLKEHKGPWYADRVPNADNELLIHTGGYLIARVPHHDALEQNLTIKKAKLMAAAPQLADIALHALYLLGDKLEGESLKELDDLEYIRHVLRKAGINYKKELTR